MIRILTRTVAATVFLFPLFAFAAYNDVTLTVDTVVISVGGVSVNVSGSSASLETIVVDTNSFTATMQSGSTMTINAPNLVINLEPALGITTSCSGGVLTATIPASSGATVTVTPSGTACSTVVSSGSSSGGGPVGLVGSMGGGGSSVSASTPVAAPAAITSSSAPSTGIFTKLTSAFKKGSVSIQVKALQQMLNQDKDTQVSLSGAGSPSKETTFFGSATLSAIKKFQVKWGIAKPGDAGYGNLGPKTRAKLNELYGK